MIKTWDYVIYVKECGDHTANKSLVIGNRYKLMTKCNDSPTSSVTLSTPQGLWAMRRECIAEDRLVQLTLGLED